MLAITVYLMRTYNNRIFDALVAYYSILVPESVQIYLPCLGVDHKCSSSYHAPLKKKTLLVNKTYRSYSSPTTRCLGLFNNTEIFLVHQRHYAMARGCF
jgi:hypothetical protein